MFLRQQLCLPFSKLCSDTSLSHTVSCQVTDFGKQFLFKLGPGGCNYRLLSTPTSFDCLLPVWAQHTAEISQVYRKAVEIIRSP